MSLRKNTGYALRHRSGRTVAVAVERTGPDRWRISHGETLSGTEGPSGPLRRALADPDSPVSWVLPDEDVKSFVNAFPPLGAKEMGRAVQGWVAREEGGAPADWRVSWQSNATSKGRGKDRQQPAFLLYAAKQVIDAELEWAAVWNVKPRRMLPGYLILDQMYRRCGPGAQELGAWNLVYLGKQDNLLCISTRESLLLTRPLPADLSGGANPEEYMARLVTEVDRSVSFARQTEASPEVEKIVVCGDPELVQSLVARLEREISTPSVAWDLAGHFDWGERDPDADLLLVLAAAATAAERSALNLGPDGGARWLGPKVRRRSLVGVAAGGSALLPLLLVGGMVTSDIQDNYLDRARSRVDEACVRAQQAEETYQAQRLLLAREVRINRFTTKNPDFESVLLRLAELTPPDIVYDDLMVREEPDGRFFLQLAGAAKAPSTTRAQQAFLDLLHALDGCDFLVGQDEPRVMQIEARDSGREALPATVFSMIYQLAPPSRPKEG